MQKESMVALEIEYDYPDIIEVWDREKAMEKNPPKWLRRREYDFDTN